MAKGPVLPRRPLSVPGGGYSVHHSSSFDLAALAGTGCLGAPPAGAWLAAGACWTWVGWPWLGVAWAGAAAGGGGATALGAAAATAGRAGGLSASARPGIWVPSSWLI